MPGHQIMSDPAEWMQDALRFEAEEYIDCGEVDCTRLAEDCAAALDLYEADGATIPDEVFDLAFQVSERWESAR